MKKFISIILILTMCISYPLTAFAAETGDKLPSGTAYSDIQGKIDDYVAGHKDTTAAVSVAVFSKDRVLMEKAYGYTDIENEIANDSEAVFEWGSCTKLITWVSLMQLAEKGAIDLNKDIREYLPKGFFRKLKYKTPITVCNLMNHDAGWQQTATDLFLKDRKDIKKLGDALRYIEPEQVNEPGKIVAYSNWGAALAGYIVECVSGQSFSDYVHENIFEPLGMEHTALNADLSDNEWVAKKREKEKCYTNNNESLGTCRYYLSLYPAGMATGTLSDFVKFAQAFAPAEGKTPPLFKKAGTLGEMLSPSLYYADNKTARICHGFWTDEFSVPVLWHDGGTAGSSSWFAFNKETGTGMVILTNQSDESVYNCGLLPLVFGQPVYYQNTGASEDISGIYVSSRSCFKGYTKLYSLFSIMNLTPSGDGTYTDSETNSTYTNLGKNSYVMDMGLKKFFFQTYTGANGKTILQTAGSDYVRINGYTVIARLALLILFLIAALYSFIILIIKIISLIRHKKLSMADIYRTVVNISTLASLLLFISIAYPLFMTVCPLYKNIQWRLYSCMALALIPAAYAVLLPVKWKSLANTRKGKAALIINGVMGLIMTVNVFYWVI